MLLLRMHPSVYIFVLIYLWIMFFSSCSCERLLCAQMGMLAESLIWREVDLRSNLKKRGCALSSRAFCGSPCKLCVGLFFSLVKWFQLLHQGWDHCKSLRVLMALSDYLGVVLARWRVCVGLLTAQNSFLLQLQPTSSFCCKTQVGLIARRSSEEDHSAGPHCLEGQW